MLPSTWGITRVLTGRMRCYGAMAVKTFENGKLIDDATDAYLDRQEIEDILCPDYG